MKRYPVGDFEPHAYVDAGYRWRQCDLCGRPEAARVHSDTNPEDRIRAHFKGLKKRWDFRRDGLPGIWMLLARQWKRPVRDIKNIVGYHGRHDW